jgi:diguanylate cyclase (GGDEF)-like protein/PAS domain S-box-containing protein
VPEPSDGHVLAEAAHELRTPLSIVLGLTERLLETPALLPAQRRDAERVRANTLMLLRRVSALLDAARLEGGRLQLDPSATDAAALLRQVVAGFEAVGAPRRVTLRLEGPDALVVRVDEEALLAVATNLLANAVKHAPPGGQVRCTLAHAGDLLTLEVCDSGAGVAPERREAIWRPWERGTGDARRAGSVGLGLPIVRGFVERMGGEVDLDDAPEGGARFRVRLPAPALDGARAEGAEDAGTRLRPALEHLRAELRAADHAAAIPERPPPDPHRLLAVVIEPHPDLALLLEELLRPHHRVLVAPSVEAALPLLADEEPDVVLCALATGPGGAEPVRRLRQEPALDEVPVIALAMDDDREERVRAFREGAQDVVAHPVAAAELLARVDAKASRRRAERARREAEETFRSAFEDAPIGMALITLEPRFLRVNPALCELLGYFEDELLAMDPRSVTHPDDLARDVELGRETLAGQRRSYRREQRYVRADGQVIWAAITTSLVRDAAGVPLYFVAQIEDVTERRELQARLQHLADHDALTGLPNRRRFEEDLERQLARCARDRESAVLLLVDLDDLKAVNERHGHQAGDAVLRAACAALRARLREGDVLARFCGDEFAVLMPRVGPEAIEAARAELTAAVEGLRVRWGATEVRVPVAVGATVLDADVTSVEQALGLADADLGVRRGRREALTA